MKPRVGILTAFAGSDEAYSLVNVVRTQLEMLTTGGYDPVLLAAEAFQGTGIWEQVECRRVAPVAAEVDLLVDRLRVLLDDLQVVLCHDLDFLAQLSNWGEAIRRLSCENPRIAWLHWQHSRGDHPPKEPVQNSWFCYPNAGDLDHVAMINSAPRNRVRYIPHPLDFEYLGWDSLAIQIAEDFKFPFVDVSGILPTRLDRQKQVEKAVRCFAGLKRAGASVCFLVADAFSTGDRFIEYKEELKVLAKSLGLLPSEFEFLGDQYEECRTRTPRRVVKALLEMSNPFILPSNAETSSLVALEASLAGNLLLLNSDFSPILHLYKRALTLPFGSVFGETRYFRNVITAEGEVKVLDDQQFFDDQAKELILPVLQSQLSLSVRRQQLQERWPSLIFSKCLEPIILESWASLGSHVNQEIEGDPEITSIVTTLDNLSILKRQLPILLRESGRVIVVNNGSIDGTREWLDRLSHPRVQSIHRENLGAGPGRNTGLDFWDQSTPYVLLVDGGILSPRNAVKQFKKYLENVPGVDIVSPEVGMDYGGHFTLKEIEMTLEMPELPVDSGFTQSVLCGSAWMLCRSRAWDGFRFSEEGPFGEPGWGVDDNEMQFQWDEAGIIHHDINSGKVPFKFYRRGSGSFMRLFKETGIWPNQYGSVYEKRNILAFQKWRKFYDPIFHKFGEIGSSFVITGLQFPELAYQVKAIHQQMSKTPESSYEILCNSYILTEESKWWLETFGLRWSWGDTTIDSRSGKILKRGPENELIWSGNVITFPLKPRGINVVYLGLEEDDTNL